MTAPAFVRTPTGCTWHFSGATPHGLMMSIDDGIEPSEPQFYPLKRLVLEGFQNVGPAALAWHAEQVGKRCVECGALEGQEEPPSPSGDTFELQLRSLESITAERDQALAERDEARDREIAHLARAEKAESAWQFANVALEGTQDKLQAADSAALDLRAERDAVELKAAKLADRVRELEVNLSETRALALAQVDRVRELEAEHGAIEDCPACGDKRVYSVPTKLPLSPANVQLLQEAAAAARELRALNGGERQDLKTIQECGELAEACSKLSRAQAQRLGHHLDGGKRGDVDAESADVLQLLLGASDESDMWGHLQRATAHVRGLIEEAKRR